MVLRPGAQQDLRRRSQACQFRAGQPRPARPALAGGNHMIVDQHVQCRQEGFKICSHERPWMPFSHVLINPTRRTRPDSESLIRSAKWPACRRRVLDAMYSLSSW